MSSRIDKMLLLSYADGALDESQRAEMEEQLERAPQLRDELAALQELQRGLRTTLAAADQLPEPGAAVWKGVARRTNRRRWPYLRTALGVGITLLIVVAFGLLLALVRPSHTIHENYPTPSPSVKSMYCGASTEGVRFDGVPDPQVSRRVQELYHLDQVALSSVLTTTGDLTEIEKAGYKERRAKLLSYLKQGKITTVNDLSYSATMLGNWPCPEYIELAYTLATKALELVNDAEHRMLYATTLDKYLMSQGRPQKFGTISQKINGKWVMYPVDPTTTDEERRRYGVPPLAELAGGFEVLSATTSVWQTTSANTLPSTTPISTPSPTPTPMPTPSPPQSFGCYPYPPVGEVPFDGTPDERVSQRVQAIFEADQATFMDSKDDAAVKASREERRKEILEYLRKGQIITAEDLYATAYMFTWDHCLEHDELAIKLAVRALELVDDRKHRQLYARALDVYLFDQGKLQRFGTIYKWENNTYELYGVDPSTTDEERRRYGIASLAELRLQAEQWSTNVQTTKQLMNPTKTK